MRRDQRSAPPVAAANARAAPDAERSSMHPRHGGAAAAAGARRAGGGSSPRRRSGPAAGEEEAPRPTAPGPRGPPLRRSTRGGPEVGGDSPEPDRGPDPGEQRRTPGAPSFSSEVRTSRPALLRGRGKRRARAGGSLPAGCAPRRGLRAVGLAFLAPALASPLRPPPAARPGDVLVAPPMGEPRAGARGAELGWGGDSLRAPGFGERAAGPQHPPRRSL